MRGGSGQEPGRPGPAASGPPALGTITAYAAAIAAFREDMPVGGVDVRAAGFLDEALNLPDRAFDVIIFSWSL